MAIKQWDLYTQKPVILILKDYTDDERNIIAAVTKYNDGVVYHPLGVFMWKEQSHGQVDGFAMHAIKAFPKFIERDGSMWLFTKNSFVSVVQHRDEPNTVLVRARRKSDLIKFLPECQAAITTDFQADYKYRLTVKKEVLKAAVAEYISDNLDYDNFKSAQGHDTLDWQIFLHRVWEAGYSMQK